MIKGSQSINVFGRVASETKVRSIPEESGRCPGIETGCAIVLFHEAQIN